MPEFVPRYRGVCEPRAAMLRLASEHRYVRWSGALDAALGVCIRCGIPPHLHGVDALAGALIVDDPNSVALLEARTVEAQRSDVEDAR